MEPIISNDGIFWYECLNSTNTELKNRLQEFDNLSIVAAKSQPAGRGQGDHTWFSSPGKNLTFSILLRFEPGMLAARDEQIINTFATPTICEFLEEEGVHAWVKQPNDIWVEDKKICGILVENVLDGKWVKESVVGMGLNINEEEFPKELPNPVSLYQLTGKKYPLEETLERIHQICKKNWIKVFMHP
ncbi:MAG: biotin--[acetyl-CoA-carboxylase] ligase [Bacteroidales bacterium]|nr:biotin--[acetyl-CoA-carboxylase] ligase [Candidatus Cryptobacteroides equifaecalis]